jgi:hypothetical protein
LSNQARTLSGKNPINWAKFVKCILYEPDKAAEKNGGTSADDLMGWGSVGDGTSTLLSPKNILQDKNDLIYRRYRYK